MLIANYSGKILEAGIDEAGRGCLAGPVVAAAVILPFDYQNKSLNDSKKLNRGQREKLREEIIKESLCYAIAESCNEEIDKVNILNATFLAMHRAIDTLPISPEFLIIDGNRFKKYKELPSTCIVKGDGKYLSIAAASILAKTYRDDVMEKLSNAYPEFRWEKNAGYPTQEHRIAIKNYGITPYHRRSFRLLPDQLSIF